MPWLKKNLTLVLGGLVGLVLLAGSGFFLFSQSAREREIAGQLDEKRAQWDTLNSLNPFPDPKNIEAVKQETARLDKLAVELKSSIRPVEVPPVSDTLSLKLLIETTISNLKNEAEAAGVSLPDRYAFTFQRLREMPQFDSNSIPKLAEQVSQITTICRVLFAAKVHSLDQLRRSPVLRDEGGSSDYLTKKGVTNTLVVRTPYDFAFKAFSGELAEVLRGMAALDQCIVVKTINIDPTTLPHAGPQPGMMPTQMPMPGSTPMPGGGTGMGMDPALRQRYGLGPAGAGGGREEGGGGPGAMDPALRQRYGLGSAGGGGMSRYGVGPGGGGAMNPPPSLMSPVAPAFPSAPAAPSGPSVVLDEKPLRVIMQIDFVKPKPVAEAGARRPAARPAADPGDGAEAAAPAAEADASAAPAE
jgi:hypothetical protein